MTVEELRAKINNGEYGWENGQLIFVDRTTYANVCQYIFNKTKEAGNYSAYGLVFISLGLNNGIHYKGYELIIED